jgi:hypothetical protein
LNDEDEIASPACLREKVAPWASVDAVLRRAMAPEEGTLQRKGTASACTPSPPLAHRIRNLNRRGSLETNANATGRHYLEQ